MRITFDQNKSNVNLAKHDIALSDAELIRWDTVMEENDNRRDYGENRTIAYGLIGDRLYCVIYTDRGDERRIISLRKANQREFDRYVCRYEIR